MTEVEHFRTRTTETLVRTWWPWIALATGLVIIALGGVMFAPGVTP
jgi:hypothetical protein